MANQVIDDKGKINCPGDCVGTYVGGDTVILTATPDPEMEFVRWEGDTSNGTVYMDRDKHVTAVFRRKYLEFPFTCADQTPDTVAIKIQYDNPALKWQLDGVEYDSGVTATFPKDDQPHTIRVERQNLFEFRIQGMYLNIDLTDMLLVPNLSLAYLQSANITGSSADVIKPSMRVFGANNTDWSGAAVLSDFAGNNNLHELYTFDSPFSGDLNELLHLTSTLELISIGADSITTDIDTIAQFTAMKYLYITSISVAGNLDAVKDMNNIIVFRIRTNSGALTTAADFDTFLPNATDISFNGTPSLTETDVDRILAAKVADCSVGGPTGGTLDLTATSVPSAQGLADAETLRNTYGWTVLTDT